MSGPVVDLAQRRHPCSPALSGEVVRASARDPDAAAERGFERRFAERRQIPPSCWSRIKSRSHRIGQGRRSVAPRSPELERHRPRRVAPHALGFTPRRLREGARLAGRTQPPVPITGAAPQEGRPGEVAALSRSAGRHRVVLTTNAFHMPRARRAFERADLQVAAAPTRYFGADAAFAAACACIAFSCASHSLQSWGPCSKRFFRLPSTPVQARSK
jgi:hypothetical protein